jgi:hypothetical protein
MEPHSPIRQHGCADRSPDFRQNDFSQWLSPPEQKKTGQGIGRSCCFKIEVWRLQVAAAPEHGIGFAMHQHAAI